MLPVVTSGDPGHLADHNALHVEYNQPEVFQRYVDYVNGDDANDGWTVGRSMKTIQGAYDDLVAAVNTATGLTVGTRTHSGELILLPGGHDIGDGVLLHPNRSIRMRGLHRTYRRMSMISESGGALPNARQAAVPYLYTSAGTPPAQYIDMTLSSGFSNGYGFEFRDFDMYFEKPGIQYGILAPNISFMVVENVGFAANSATTDEGMYALRGPLTATGDDCSWWYIQNNYFSQLGIAHIGTDTVVGQHNRHTFRENVAFGRGHDTSTVAIAMYYSHGGFFEHNNLEHFGTGILFGQSSWQNTVIGDAGEFTQTFVDIPSGFGNLILAQGINVPAGVDSLVKITGASANNVVLTSAFTGQKAMYGANGYVNDSSVVNFLMAPSTDTARGKFFMPPTVYTDATRPTSTADLRLGTMIWNSTSAQPEWFNGVGSGWVDATGAAT